MKTKIAMFITLLFFTAALLPYAKASVSDQTRTYLYSLYNLKINVESPPEAYPNQNITIHITAEASAKLMINYTAVELYTINSSTMNDEKFAYIEFINYSNPLLLYGGQSSNQTSHTATVPALAFNVVYGKLILMWTEMGTDESNTYSREPTFIISSLCNPELEGLRDLLPKLQKQSAILRRNVTDLNDALTDVLDNLNDTKNRYEGEIGNTRSVATLLAVTTVFFVATTVYLVMKKPKDYF